MSRHRRTPQGTVAIHWTISQEMKTALHEVVKERNARLHPMPPLTVSRFVQDCLTADPEVSAHFRAHLTER